MGAKVERPQVHAAQRVHVPASTVDAPVGVRVSPGCSCGLCRGRSPCPAAGLQELYNQWERDGSNIGFFFSQTPGEKHRAKGMHKRAAHMRRSLDTSQAALRRSHMRIAVLFRCCSCRPSSQRHRCHRPAPIPVPHSEGRGHNPAVPLAQPQARRASPSSHA